MAITSISGITSGFQFPRIIGKNIIPTVSPHRLHTYWGIAGVPGAGTWDNTLNGVVLSSTSAQVPGQLHCFDPAAENQHIATILANTTTSGMLWILDRLWHNGGITITSTSSQSITSPTWPARDDNGATLGDGLLCAVEVSSVTGAGTPTITIGYTNSANTSGRTATNWMATTATTVSHSMFPIGLQAGDNGIRSIQSITLSASWTSGAINVVVYRVLGVTLINAATGGGMIDGLTGGLGKMYNGTVPYFAFVPVNTTAPALWGAVVYTRG